MSTSVHDVSSLNGSESKETNDSRRTQPPGKNGTALPVAPKGNQYRRKHGLNSLKKAWSQLGNRAIDGRSPAGVALRKWRRDLIADLGGDDAVSTQQLALVDLAVKSKLLLDSIDTWLLTPPTLVNARKRSLIPVVLQRQTLADGLARYLSQLGLVRRHKVKTLAEVLERDDSEQQGVNGNGENENPSGSEAE